MLQTRLKYGFRYCKLAIIHIFKTKNFGVNNLWWAQQPSAIGWHWYQILFGVLTVFPILRNYQSLKVRSCLGWLPESECIALGFKPKS